MNAPKPPVALALADELYRYALGQGAPINSFELLLTLGEGYELLDWIPGAGLFSDLELLRQDIEEAKIKGDPWLVLDNFTLKGMRIRCSDRLPRH